MNKVELELEEYEKLKKEIRDLSNIIVKQKEENDDLKARNNYYSDLIFPISELNRGIDILGKLNKSSFIVDVNRNIERLTTTVTIRYEINDKELL